MPKQVVTLLSAHDLEEIRVIMSNYTPSQRCIMRRQDVARDSFGFHHEDY